MQNEEATGELENNSRCSMSGHSRVSALML